MSLDEGADYGLIYACGRGRGGIWDTQTPRGVSLTPSLVTTVHPARGPSQRTNGSNVICAHFL